VTVALGRPNLDFEVKAAYTLVVQVTDNGGLTANATFAVSLTNVNEAPYWAMLPPVISARAAITQALTPAVGAPYSTDQDLVVVKDASRSELLTY